MPGAHRNGDARFCGATTIVQGQGSVKVNGKLWAVHNDPESHGDGNLRATYGAKNVRISGKLVTCAVGDSATGDDADHNPPETHPSESSGDVFVYGQ